MNGSELNAFQGVRSFSGSTAWINLVTIRYSLGYIHVEINRGQKQLLYNSRKPCLWKIHIYVIFYRYHNALCIHIACPFCGIKARSPDYGSTSSYLLAYWHSMEIIQGGIYNERNLCRDGTICVDPRLNAIHHYCTELRNSISPAYAIEFC